MSKISHLERRNKEHRVDFPPTKEALDIRPPPDWYRNAKLGIFVHWGLYSVPAYAERTGQDYTAYMRDLMAGKANGDRIPYAEWYLNGLRVPTSATARHHAATYGPGYAYPDFRGPFQEGAQDADLTGWATLFADVGARYVVMVTRHLDGYPLWPTDVAHPRMPVDYRSPRDLVGELTEAVRAKGMRMGLYYGGGMDWTFGDRPIRTMTDLMRYQALGPEYARYAAAQWHELVERYQPAVLWNDMGWPAEHDPHELFAAYYAAVPDGVVNDRWTQLTLPRNRLVRSLYLGFVGQALRLMAKSGRSIPQPPRTVHHDFVTHEYALPEAAPAGAWELVRGLGASFGYNAQETSADTLASTELIHLLVDVVAAGGNLLLNVGPDGAGRIPEIQQVPLRALGAWLDRNGEAVFDTEPFGTEPFGTEPFGTEPWTRAGVVTASGDRVRFTRRDATVYAIILAPQPAGDVVLKDIVPSAVRVDLVGGARDLPCVQNGGDLRVTLPDAGAGQPHAYVLAISSR